MAYTYGFAPRTGSKFFPVQRVSVVPNNRIPRKPTVWLEQFFPCPAVRVSYDSILFDGKGRDGHILSVDDVIDQACAARGISREQLTGRGNSPVFVSARREVSEALHKRGWSTPQIGALLGRDHSSIVYMLGRSKRNVKRRAARAAKEAEAG